MATISTLVVEVEAKTSKFSSGMKTAVAGLGTLAVAGAYAFNQFEESNKVAEQTNAVLKSTGGAANVTAQQVSDLAGALSEKSGVDDEAIQSGENMLLTFKNIRNEAGKNNDIFNQASSVTLDMAASMAAASGGAIDMKSASIQVGKALNDPIKGLTALSRVGVTFTDQQTKQITKLVESGQTLKAQKIILGELSSEFAGSAAAGKTAMGTLSVTVGNLAEAVGGVLAPAINSVLNVLITFFGWLSKYPALLVTLGGILGTVAAAFLLVKVQELAAAVATNLQTAATIASTVAHGALTAAISVATAAQWLWNAALTANPIGLIIVAIAAVIAIIVILVKHFHLADDIMNVLKKTVSVVWGFIKAYVGLVVKIVVGYIKVWIAVIGFLIKATGAVVQAVSTAFRAVYTTIKQWLTNAWNFITGIWDKIIRFFGGLGGKLAHAARGMWDWLWDTLKGVLNMVIRGLNFVIDAINSALNIHVNMPGPLPDVNVNGPNIPNINPLGASGFSGIATSTAGGAPVNVYVQGSVIAEHDLAEAVQKALLRSKRRSGTLGLA